MEGCSYFGFVVMYALFGLLLKYFDGSKRNMVASNMAILIVPKETYVHLLYALVQFVATVLFCLRPNFTSFCCSTCSIMALKSIPIIFQVVGDVNHVTLSQVKRIN